MSAATLTARQAQVAAMRAEGKSPRAIALELGLSTQRVYAILGQIKRRENGRA